MSEGKNQTLEQPYHDWIKKIHDASVYEAKLPHEPKTKVEEESVNRAGKWVILAAVLLFFIALAPRLFFIFILSDPDNPGAGWFGDAYHHWQIAYLSKEVGLSHGFLRLWDLKGMEYFWGFLHPLFTMIAFTVTGMSTVGIERAMTALFGSISVFLITLLVHRHWNFKASLAAGLFAALNPVGVFNDGTGMVEPIGITFLLLGVYLWPTHALFSGLSFAIALMSRAEYWVFSIVLVAAMIIFSKKVHADKKAAIVIGFVVLTVIYMKYLLVYTGNPIYPFYENYTANIFGTWQLKPALTPEDIQAKYVFLMIFIAGVLLSLITLWKRPKGMFVYLLGLGNWIFLGATFGLGQYIKSYAVYVWYVRFMILPYAFLGIVLSVILFYYIPKMRFIKSFDMLKFNYLSFFGIFILFQLVWIPIWNKYATTIANWHGAERFAESIANRYKGGGLLLFDGNPEITYALVRNHAVLGRNIVGQMFDPYFYFTEDPYKTWSKKRKIVLRFIKENNIRTIATYSQYVRYKKLTEFEPEFFYQDKIIPNSNIIIYQVKDELYQTDI